jgi:hypothetical protein
MAKRNEIGGKYLLLEKKGYLTNDNLLTIKALDILEDFKIVDEIKAPIQDKFSEWVNQLHSRLQQRILDLTGKKQIRFGGRYSFLCNSKDLETKLKKIIAKHKITDYTLIEKTLIRHIDKCNAAKWNYSTLIEYYIEKDGISKLVTDMQDYDPEETIKEHKSAGETFI